MTDINYDLIRTILNACSSEEQIFSFDKDTIYTHYRLLIEQGFIKQGLAIGTHVLSEYDKIIYKISKCELTTKGFEFCNCLENRIADAEIKNLRAQGKANFVDYVFAYLKKKILEI